MNPYDESLLADTAQSTHDPYGMMWRPPCMPYISAYAIAVKHGFQGSEKEWLHSLGSVFVVKVEDFRQGENDAGTFTYNTTWEEIEYAVSQGRIVALDFYGSLAWMSQIGNGFVRFTGEPYYADGQHCYTEFRIMEWGENEFVTYAEKENPVHWFEVHISAVEGGFATDENAAKIYDAVSKGRLVRGVEPGGRMMQLTRCDSENAWFTMVNYDGYEDRFSLVAYWVGTDEVSQRYVVIGNGPADGGAQAVWVNFSHNGSGLTADMSSVEIRDAVNLGSIVLGRDPAGRVLQLYRCGETYAWFTATGYDHETEKFYEVVYLMENGAVSMDTWSQTDPEDGEDGGYYLIQTQKIDANTLRIRFTASKPGMSEIEDQYITLPEGSAGADAVIWHTNVAPNNGAYFAFANLTGPTNAVPAPGHMVVSSYTGKGYFITAVDGDSATIGSHTVQIKGDPGQDGQPGRDGQPGQDGQPGRDGEDGVGIASIKQTTTSSADGGSNVFTATLTNGSTATFTVKNGSKGNPGQDGQNGRDGQDGGYYTVDVEQLNSTTVKLSFVPSEEGMAEILPEVITLPQGPKGADGTSVTHSWNGTTLTVTSAAGTSSANLKGGTGDTGARGTGLLPITTAPSSYTTAVNGLTPTYRIALSTVKSQAGVTEVFAGDTLRYSYYHYPVIYVDASYVYCGARVSIRGATGAAGAAGYTPVRGTDYWTAADIAEIKSYVDEAILGGAW